MLLSKVLSLILSGTMLFSLPIFPMSIFSGLFSKEKSYTVHSDLKYGDAELNLIDIYVPKSAYERDYNAVILFIHGGSWMGGEKKEMNSYCETYAKKGYITATMSYSLVTEENGVNAFTMLDDIDLAIKKIKKFSDEKKLNITKIATCGYSAGGHISSLYAYTRAQNSAIKLVFTANKVAPSDFHSVNWDNAYGEGLGYGLTCMLSGVKYDESLVESGEFENVINSVSPAKHIDKNSVPTIAGYGGKDTICPIGNALATKAALINSGIDYEYFFYPKSNHGLSSDSSVDAQYKEAFLKYCEKYFGYVPASDDNSTGVNPSEPVTDNKVGSSVGNITVPDVNIPDTNSNTSKNNSTEAENISENTSESTAESSTLEQSNQNSVETKKSGFKYKKELILSAVLIAVCGGIAAWIIVNKKRENSK